MADPIRPVELDIHSEGDGCSLVFSTGWLDDRSIWDDVAHRLASTYRTTTWSMRAHGASGTPADGDYSRAASLDDLGRAVVAGGTPATLIGHSLGGYLSLAYAIAHPDDVAALVLVSAGPGFRSDDAREKWNDSVDRAASKNDIPAGSEALSKHVDSWVIDHLDDITAPTMVLIGERDKNFAAAAALFEKRLDVRASLVVEGAGHSPHRSHSDEVATAIADFLGTLDAAAHTT